MQRKYPKRKRMRADASDSNQTDGFYSTTTITPTIDRMDVDEFIPLISGEREEDEEDAARERKRIAKNIQQNKRRAKLRKMKQDADRQQDEPEDSEQSFLQPMDSDTPEEIKFLSSNLPPFDDSGTSQTMIRTRAIAREQEKEELELENHKAVTEFYRLLYGDSVDNSSKPSVSFFEKPRTNRFIKQYFGEEEAPPSLGVLSIETVEIVSRTPTPVDQAFAESMLLTSPTIVTKQAPLAPITGCVKKSAKAEIYQSSLFSNNKQKPIEAENWETSEYIKPGKRDWLAWHQNEDSAKHLNEYAAKQLNKYATKQLDKRDEAFYVAVYGEGFIENYNFELRPSFFTENAKEEPKDETKPADYKRVKPQ